MSIVEGKGAGVLKGLFKGFMSSYRNTKKISLARMAVYISVVSSILLALGCIIVSAMFFRSETIRIYDGMETSLTRSALVEVDLNEVNDLILKTAEVVKTIDDPVAMRENSKEEYFEKFEEIQNSKEYKALWERLNNTRRATISTAYCLSLIYPEKGYWVYVMDASDSNVQRCELLFDDFSDYIGHPGIDYIGNVTYSQKYGKVRTDGIAVYTDDANGIYSYLTADIPISTAEKNVKLFLMQTSLAALVIVTLSCLFLFIAINRFAVQPINNMAGKAEDFVGMYEERFDSHAESDIFENIYAGNVKELLKLSGSLRSMELEMNSYLHDIDRLAGEKARIGTELDIATKIQEATIPRNFSDFDNRPQFEIYGDCKPAKEVGGDFYDFFLLDDDHLCLVMADVSGKGIPAALYMMVSKIAIQTRAEQGGTPSEILEYVNDRLSANNSVDMFMTISTGHVIATNAGHEYPAITDENGNYTLMKDKHGFVCGGMKGLKFKDYEFDIPKGGRLFLYTDGVPENQNNAEEFYGTDRMIDALNECKTLSPEATVASIYKSLHEFAEGADQFDDTTMLNIWYLG